MAGAAVNLNVKAPSNWCGFCSSPMTAIERWHDCPQRRLAAGLYVLRLRRHAEQQARAFARLSNLPDS